MVFYTAPRSACRHRRWHCNAPLSPPVPFLCFQQLTTVAVCNRFILLSLQQWGGVVGEATFQFRFSSFQSISSLECAVPKTRSCNSFKMRSYGKRWGGRGRHVAPTADVGCRSEGQRYENTRDA